MGGNNHRDLTAWQKAMGFAESTCSVSARLAGGGRCGVTSRIGRAAASVASDIAEGQGRRSGREFARRLAIAHGSAREPETQAILASRPGCIDRSRLRTLLSGAGIVGRLLTGLTRSHQGEG